MTKQFAVIGLGNFGHYLAAHLYKKGHEVLAIDLNNSRVDKIKNQVTQAVVADATDPVAMKSLGLQDMDGSIVCIGSVLSNSILTAMNMIDVGVKRVIAKAISESHGRILEKIGVAEVLFPEKDFAISTAERLHDPNMIDYLPLIEDYSIVQLAPLNEFIGKTLRELDLINKYGIQVVAVKEVIPDNVNIIPTGQFVIKDSDILILLGPNKSLEKLK